MNADLEEQEDELLALQSIFGSEEFVRNDFSGEIRVSVDLPVDFNVVLKHGKTLRQYVISFLPPLLLTFELPVDYPSSSPPSFTLTCIWLTPTQLSSLRAQLIEIYEATGGAVVLFSWIQFLREDALKLLNIHNLLELPSDQINTLPETRDQQEPELLQEYNNTSKPKPTDESDLCGPDTSASDEDVLAAAKNTDSHTASALDSHKADQNDLTSFFNQSSLNTEFKPDHPKALPSEIKIPNLQDSEETAFQTSEFEADRQGDLSLPADNLEHLPVSESIHISEDAFNKSDNSASGSSNLQDLSATEPTSWPARPKAITLNNGQTISGISLTPSQKLLSQILIYNAEQKQRVFATTMFNCGVCLVDWLGSDCVQLFECGHLFCRACLRDFCKVQITEGNVRGVACPEEGCTGTPTPAQVNSLVGEELFSRYDRLLLQSTLDRMSDVMYCPRNSCGSPVISEKSSSVAMCSVCSFAFCVACKKTYHGANKCYEEDYKTKTEDFLLNFPRSEEGLKALLDDYAAGSRERRRLLESRYGKKKLLGIETDLNEKWKVVNTKACPHCFSPIQKDGGCPMMRCTWCEWVFTWSD